MVSQSAINRFQKKSRPTGLYLTFEENGKIKRTLVSKEKECELEPTTINDEIILFSEINYKHYETVVNLLDEFSEHLILDKTEIDKKYLKTYIKTTENFISALEKEQPLDGVLTRTYFEDVLSGKDIKESLKEDPVFTTGAINHCFSDILYFRLVFTELLYDMCDKKELNFKEKYVLISSAEFTQVITMDEDKSPEYYFRSPAYYYLFLLMHFVKNKTKVQICECCDRFFVPKSNRKTLYCDRIIKDGKTCKEWAPILKHKLEVQKDIVLKAFDTNKNKMYKRFERTRDSLNLSSKSLSFDEYSAWRDKATEARDKYVAKEISAEEALRIIEVND